MDAEVKRRFTLALLLLLSACGSLNDKTPTVLGESLPGLGDLDAPTKAEKEDAAWWAHYYGEKSSQE